MQSSEDMNFNGDMYLENVDPRHIVQLYDKAQRNMVPGYFKFLENLALLAGKDRRPDFSVVDLGCGTGNLAYRLNQKFPSAHIVCVDRSFEALEVAKSKFLNMDGPCLEFIQMDFAKQMLIGRYDTIVSSFALHHLPESSVPNLFKQIYSVLKPGGACWIGETIYIESPQEFRAIQMRYDNFLEENIALGHITRNEVDERLNLMKKLEAFGFNFLKAMHLPVVLNILKSVGFSDVQCPYLEGNLAIFGGIKTLPI